MQYPTVRHHNIFSETQRADGEFCLARLYRVKTTEVKQSTWQFLKKTSYSCEVILFVPTKHVMKNKIGAEKTNHYFKKRVDIWIFSLTYTVM